MQSRIGGGVKAVNGEVGVLIYVHAAADSRKCYLVIEDKNENYTGTLLFHNARLCRQFADLLQHHLDRSMKEIGDLEVILRRNKSLRSTHWSLRTVDQLSRLPFLDRSEVAIRLLTRGRAEAFNRGHQFLRIERLWQEYDLLPQDCLSRVWGEVGRNKNHWDLGPF